ncbi:hypothetical protein VSS74_07195 [Conexibacter stalactiti]|uniref:Uncharacterized protein n=1 Tax=Conexibacter stalactiti TaxID=1940611 RepID=A0ABU4HLE1_9ACTN|nr:hypothetical protein [Conexibacter stalactiti]MDW5594114.1 hypothetical protein [Conexibacter stalactiti]MEC5034756.1 hypothetical protein [Conexibacter stalactiti]
MRPTRSIRAVGALAVLALALPTSASAVPSVTSAVVKTGNPGVTFLTDPAGAALTNTQTRYGLSLDGYALGFAENNGAIGDGVLDYSALPSEYRAPMTAEQKLAYPAAQTDLQAHATCAGVPALSDSATILAWQTNAANDPSYAYVPWQKAAAGLGDDPARWIAVVRRAVRVDLATVTDFRAACEGIAGRYYAADTSSPVANALVAGAVAPLEAQIATLKTSEATLKRSEASLRREKETSDRALAAARAALAVARETQRAADVAYQAFFTRPIQLTLAARRFAPPNGVALITGAPTDPVAITVEVTRRQRRALGLSSQVLVEANGEIGPEGALLVRLTPDRATARQLKRALARGRGIAVRVLAESGAHSASARATLTR